MPDEKLQYVIDIIRESADFDTEQEEIDIEIDKIDTVTQRKLQNFVLKNKPKQRGKTQKNKPAPASPEKAEPPEIEPTIEISPKPLPVNKEKDGCFSDTESDSEASDDKPGFVGGGWEINTSDESGNEDSGKEDEDPSWGIALVESKKIQARKKEKDVRDAEELVEQKKVKEKKEADIAAKEKEKESLRRKEEEDRVREEKEKNERDRQKKLRQQIFDSTNITQTVKIDDKGDMEDYENYACNDGGDSPASSNFGF